jgi:hypothetical protein
MAKLTNMTENIFCPDTWHDKRLTILSLMELAVYQSLAELMFYYGQSQSWGKCNDAEYIEIVGKD